MNSQSNPLNSNIIDTRRDTGVLPHQSIAALIRDGEIKADQAILSQQVQPASIDLRLGTTAYRMQASFLPGPNCTVREKIEMFVLQQLSIRLTRKLIINYLGAPKPVAKSGMR